jgi:hypothetical protein
MTDGTRSRFVQPLERVLTLDNGDTLTVRRRLTAGEQMDMFGRLYSAHGNGGGALRLNPVQTGFALIVAYLIDWSFADAHGAKVIIRGEPLAVVEAAIRMLDPDDFQEVKRAVELHDAEVVAERATVKKTPNGDDGSKAISESRSGVGGASSGFAN